MKASEEHCVLMLQEINFIATEKKKKIKFHLGVAPFDKNPAKPARYINSPKQIQLNSSRKIPNELSLLKVTWP